MDATAESAQPESAQPEGAAQSPTVAPEPPARPTSPFERFGGPSQLADFHGQFPPLGIGELRGDFGGGLLHLRVGFGDTGLTRSPSIERRSPRRDD